VAPGTLLGVTTKAAEQDPRFRALSPANAGLFFLGLTPTKEDAAEAAASVIK